MPRPPRKTPPPRKRPVATPEPTPAAVYPIDPIKFGRLQSEVETMQERLEKIDRTLEQLLELANRSRGGFWVGMGLVATLAGIATKVIGDMIPGGRS